MFATVSAPALNLITAGESYAAVLEHCANFRL
jgi:hypothetical protein